MALTALMASPNRRDATCACNFELLDRRRLGLRRTHGARAERSTSAAFVPSELEVLGEPRALRQIMVNLMVGSGLSRRPRRARRRRGDRGRRTRRDCSLGVAGADACAAQGRIARALLRAHAARDARHDVDRGGGRRARAGARSRCSTAQRSPISSSTTEGEKPRLGVPRSSARRPANYRGRQFGFGSWAVLAAMPLTRAMLLEIGVKLLALFGRELGPPCRRRASCACAPPCRRPARRGRARP